MTFSPINTVGPPASTVPINTPIAVDTVAGLGAVQLLKLVDGRENGAVAIPGDANGLYVQLRASAIAGGVPVTISGAPAAGGALPVSFAGGFSVDTELPTGVLLADNLSNPTTPLVGAANMVWDPANGWLRVRGDTGFGIDVDVTRSVLPSGAATSAKQPAFGTAGAAGGSADVLSVQGRSGMVPVDVNILSGGTGGGTMDLATIKTVAVSTSTGPTDTGTQRVVLAATQPTLTVQGTGAGNAVPVILAAETTKVIGTVNIAAAQVVGLAAGANTIGNVGINSPLPAGTNAIGKLAANGGVVIGDVNQAGTWTVQPGNTPNTTAWLVTGTGGTFPLAAGQVAIAAWGHGASGAAAPTSATLGGQRASTALAGAGVADGQLVGAMGDRFGRAVMALDNVREQRAAIGMTITNTAVAQTLIGAAGAGTFNDLAGLVLSNTSATDTIVTVSDGLASFSLYVAAKQVVGFAFPGINVSQQLANTAWTITTLTAITDLRVLAVFVRSR